MTVIKEKSNPLVCPGCGGEDIIWVNSVWTCRNHKCDFYSVYGNDFKITPTPRAAWEAKQLQDAPKSDGSHNDNFAILVNRKLLEDSRQMAIAMLSMPEHPSMALRPRVEREHMKQTARIHLESHIAQLKSLLEG